MIKKKGKPITGTNTEMRPKAPVMANQAKTSVDLQNRITKSPQPFTNSGGVSTMEPRIQSGLKRTTPGAKALPGGAAVGYNKLPNQSKQIGGRMGYPPPARKRGNNAFQKVKKGAAFYGQ